MCIDDRAGMDSSDDELLAYLEEADSDADSEEEEETRRLHAKREARVQETLRRKLAGLPPVEPASAAVDDSDDDFGLSSDDDTCTEVGRQCFPPFECVAELIDGRDLSRPFPLVNVLLTFRAALFT